MAPPLKLAHIVWKTSQVAVMRDWYCNVLEAHVVFENDLLCFITYDDEHHRMAFVGIGDGTRPSDGANGVQHLAFTYADMGDLFGTYRRLRDQGIDPYWCVNHGATTSMYFQDPDGNNIELQIDNFDDAAGVQEWFEEGHHLTNPIGVNFDPDDLMARYEAGEPHAELIKW